MHVIALEIIDERSYKALEYMKGRVQTKNFEVAYLNAFDREGKIRSFYMSPTK